MSDIPKDMELLISEKDFDTLSKFTEEPPSDTPAYYKCEVTLAKWKGEEKTVKRRFYTEQKAKDFCAEVLKAGGKVGKNPEAVLENPLGN